MDDEDRKAWKLLFKTVNERCEMSDQTKNPGVMEDDQTEEPKLCKECRFPIEKCICELVVEEEFEETGRVVTNIEEKDSGSEADK